MEKDMATTILMGTLWGQYSGYSGEPLRTSLVTTLNPKLNGSVHYVFSIKTFPTGPKPLNPFLKISKLLQSQPKATNTS